MSVTGHYAFGPAVRLAVEGSRPARRHFRREYGAAAAPAAGPPDVRADVRLGIWPPGAAAGAAGGHKTARWRVRLGDPGRLPLEAAIAVGGGPPGFALSLVQGYYVEPLVAVALARARYVALPSAAILSREGALVIMGRSRSGKSSLSVRALAGGRSILGDDQVVIGADGGCWPYPRRLRVYPDLADTAPQAWTRLSPATRRALRTRAALRRATRGFVAPSLPVPVGELGAPAPPARVRAARLVVVQRSGELDRLAERERDGDWAAREAGAVLADQRSRFARTAAGGWSAALADAAQREDAVVRSWLSALPVTQLTVPDAWAAPRAIGALADRLGTDG
jgi:hypothetical protein